MWGRKVLLADHIWSVLTSRSYFLPPERGAASEFFAGDISRSAGNEITQMAHILSWCDCSHARYLCFPCLYVSEPASSCLQGTSLYISHHIRIPYPYSLPCQSPATAPGGLSWEVGYFWWKLCQTSAQNWIWQCLMGCLLCPSFLSLSKEGRVDEEVQGCFWLAQKKHFLSCVFLLLKDGRGKQESPLVPLAPSPRIVPVDSPSLYALMPAAMHLLQPDTLQLHGVLVQPSHYSCTPHGTALPPTLKSLWHNHAAPLSQLYVCSYVYLNWCCTGLSPSNYAWAVLVTPCMTVPVDVCPHSTCLCISPHWPLMFAQCRTRFASMTLCLSRQETRR